MSTLAGGFPDWQRITQWFGTALDQATGYALGAGAKAVGPLNVRNFASLVVCVRPVGGNVTVTVDQLVPAGPAALKVSTSFVVVAGNVLFQSIVLLAGAATVTFQGSAGGETLDYAIVPSNVNINAEVSTLAQLGFQLNDVAVANETALDFEDGLGVTWSVVDDPGNTRVKVTPRLVPIASQLLAADQATIDFQNVPQTYTHLFAAVYARTDRAAASDNVGLRLNNDAGGNYYCNHVYAFGATAAGLEEIATTKPRALFCNGGTAPANVFGGGMLWIPHYAQAVNKKLWVAVSGNAPALSAGNIQPGAGFNVWDSTAAVNRLTFSPWAGANFKAGTEISLYGLT